MESANRMVTNGFPTDVMIGAPSNGGRIGLVNNFMFGDDDANRGGSPELHIKNKRSQE